MDVERAAELLGVARDASPAEVRRAYRSIIRVVHPDHAGGGTTSQAAQLIDAYGVLRAASRAATTEVAPPATSATAPPRPARRSPPGRTVGAPMTITRVDDDTIAFGTPSDETLAALLEGAHDLGELTYLDRSLPIIEVICQFEGTPTLSLVITLQGRGDRTEAFCTVESIEADAGPPAAGVVDVLIDLLHQRQAMVTQG